MTIPLLVDSISTHHAVACEYFIEQVEREQQSAELSPKQWRAIRKIIRDSVTMGALCEMNNPYPHPEQLNEIET